MSVIDRLKRLTHETAPTLQDKQAIISDLRRRMDAILARRIPSVLRPAPSYHEPPQPLEDVITGEAIENTFGACFFTRTRHNGTSTHGDRLIRDLTAIDMQAAGLLASSPDLKHLHIGDALFLDTETTGLSGGTGTFPFLIGLGWFEGDAFITCQLFARDYPEERAMLAFLQEMASGKRFLVTFNGRAFDINLLTTRYVLNRLPDPLAGKPHLDLLNPARRLLAHRTSNCRLVTLEAEVLGFTRVGDVPGAEIPQRYFDWLRSRNPHLLADVFEHNRYDIVSMAALASHLTSVLSGRHEPRHAHPGDLLAAARLHHERGSLDSSQHLLEAIICSHTTPHVIDARKLLSLIHKRLGRWQQAVPIWEELLACDPGEIFAAEELAKCCEHRIHDFERAIVLVEQALAHPHRYSETDRANLTHRLNRLLTKHGKSV